MSKKKDKMVSAGGNPGFHKLTLREEITGRKQINGAGSSNLKSILKMQHYQNLSSWASGEALHSLAALYGWHLGSCHEACGTQRDSSLFQCQQCKSVLQPGNNCSVRIKTHGRRTQRRKKSSSHNENSVVYTCHFCSHENIIRGTPKGFMKQLLTSQAKSMAELAPKCFTNYASASSDRCVMNEEISKSATETVLSSEEGVVVLLESKSCELDQNLATVISNNAVDTSPERTPTILSSERERRKRVWVSKISNDTKEKPVMLDTVSGGSSRKRRKSWSSLREIAENSERESNRHIANLTIPLFL